MNAMDYLKGIEEASSISNRNKITDSDANSILKSLGYEPDDCIKMYVYDSCDYVLLKNDMNKFNGLTIYRIMSLVEHGDIDVGDLGGYISRKVKLCPAEGGWVYDNAICAGNCNVGGQIRGYAECCSKTLYENSDRNNRLIVMGIVDGKSQVYGDVLVECDAEIHGYSQIHGHCVISANARISDTRIEGNIEIPQTTLVNCKVKGSGPLRVHGITYENKNIEVFEYDTVFKTSRS